MRRSTFGETHAKRAQAPPGLATIPGQEQPQPRPDEWRVGVPIANTNHESIWGWTMVSASSLSSPVHG